MRIRAVPYSNRVCSSSPRKRSAMRRPGPRHGVGQDDEELLAAVAAGEIVLAQVAQQLLPELAQHPVAAGVPVAVVDRLEIVHVHQDAAERDVEAQRPVDLHLHAQEQAAAVVQAGQGVDRGEPAQLPVRALQLPQPGAGPSRARRRRRISVRWRSCAAGGTARRAVRPAGGGREQAQAQLVRGERLHEEVVGPGLQQRLQRAQLLRPDDHQHADGAAAVRSAGLPAEPGGVRRVGPGASRRMSVSPSSRARSASASDEAGPARPRPPSRRASSTIWR